LPYSKSIERNYSLDTNSRGGTGVTRITPAASEGVIDTRGIVPPAIPRSFFLLISSLPQHNHRPSLFIE